VRKMPDPLVSILMPTYNDVEYIASAIDSVSAQSHQNWELIIVNDGSSDDTEEKIIPCLNDHRIRYYKLQQNSGQLNALHIGSQLVKGEFVTLLHSDDAFKSENSLEHLVQYMTHYTCDGVFADIPVIDGEGKACNILKTISTVGQGTVAALLALRGSNCVSDVFFVRSSVFFSNVIERYIQWNMPYWLLNSQQGIDTLDLHKVEPWYLYRVYKGNYVHSDVGKFEASNGCLRSVLETAEYYDVIGFSISRPLAFLSMRLFHRPFVIYNTRPYSRPYGGLVRSALQCYYKNDELEANSYLSAVIAFYTCYPSKRVIYLSPEMLNQCETWYTGKDARMFHTEMCRGSLDPLYNHLLKEARSGFGSVVVPNERYQDRLHAALRFLNLRATVSIMK